MAHSESSLQDVPLVQGSVVGFLTWVLGYLFTYLIASSEIRDSQLSRFLEFLGEDPATFEMVGWVFYNAHFVDVVFEGVPFFGAESFLGGEEGFTMLLYAIPPLVLIGAGLAIGRYGGARDVSAGAVAGLTVVPGYLLLSIAGVFLFEITLGDASGAPDLVAGIFLAGLVFPALFGALGGVLAGSTAE